MARGGGPWQAARRTRSEYGSRAARHEQRRTGDTRRVGMPEAPQVGREQQEVVAGDEHLAPLDGHRGQPVGRALGAREHGHAPSRLWITRSISLMPMNGAMTPPRP